MLTENDREKVMAVAKDVIARIDLQKLCLRGNEYLHLTQQVDRGLEGDLQQHVDFIENNCHVCQLGACLLSKARLYNSVNMTIVYLINGTLACCEIREQLEDIFTREQLDMLEAAFEKETFDWMQEAKYGNLVAAIHFGKQHYTLDMRVRACMQNILDHGGVFTPPIPVNSCDD